MLNNSLTNRKDWIYLLLLFIYTAIVVFFCSKMSPFYPIQEWSDVNLYFNIGKAIMNGQTLYTESFDHKGPFIFLFYGIAYLISNDSFLGIFFIQIIVWTCLTYSAYFISRLFVNQAYSFITATFFLLIFISHTSEGGSAEEFITASMAISLYLFIKYFRQSQKHKVWHMYIHGLMWGIVFFIKFNLTVFWIFPLIAIGLILLMQKEYKNLLVNILAFIGGGLTIALPVIIYFLSKNALQEAIDAYFVLNSSFRMGTLTETIHKIGISFYQRLRFETVEFIIILIGAFVFPWLYLKNNIAKLSFPLAFLALFSMAFMGGYIYYYSIPYYLFALLGCLVLVGLITKFLTIKNEWILIAVTLLITISGSIYRKNIFGKFDANKLPTVVDKFLPTILKEKDRSLINLGLDDANALFTYANIIPNVKYFVAPNLPHEVYPQLRNEQTQYIVDKKTMFVVLAEHTINAEYFLDLEALKENYEVVDIFKEYYEWHKTDRYYYLYKKRQ